MRGGCFYNIFPRTGKLSVVSSVRDFLKKRFDLFKISEK